MLKSERITSQTVDSNNENGMLFNLGHVKDKTEIKSKSCEDSENDSDKTLVMDMNEELLTMLPEDDINNSSLLWRKEQSVTPQSFTNVIGPVTPKQQNQCNVKTLSHACNDVIKQQKISVQQEANDKMQIGNSKILIEEVKNLSPISTSTKTATVSWKDNLYKNKQLNSTASPQIQQSAICQNNPLNTNQGRNQLKSLNNGGHINSLHIDYLEPKQEDQNESSKMVYPNAQLLPSQLNLKQRSKEQNINMRISHQQQNSQQMLSPCTPSSPPTVMSKVVAIGGGEASTRSIPKSQSSSRSIQPGIQTQNSLASRNSKMPKASILKNSNQQQERAQNAVETSTKQTANEEFKIMIFKPEQQEAVKPNAEAKYTFNKVPDGKSDRQLSSFHAESVKKKQFVNEILNGTIHHRKIEELTKSGAQSGAIINHQVFEQEKLSVPGLTRPGTQTVQKLGNLLVSQNSKVSTSRADQKVVSFSNAVEEEEKSSFGSDSSFSAAENESEVRTPTPKGNIGNTNKNGTNSLSRGHSRENSKSLVSQHQKQQSISADKKSSSRRVITAECKPQIRGSGPLNALTFQLIDKRSDDSDVLPQKVNRQQPQIQTLGHHVQNSQNAMRDTFSTIQQTQALLVNDKGLGGSSSNPPLQTISSNSNDKLPQTPYIGLTEKHKCLDPFHNGGDVTPTFKKVVEHTPSSQPIVGNFVNNQSSQSGQGARPRVTSMPVFMYEDIEYCHKLLKNGIKARKYHYSQKHSEDCIIMISNDKKRLIWQYLGAKRNRKSDCSLRDIEAFVYGPFSGTFQEYREEILKSLQQQNNKITPEIDLDKENHTKDQQNPGTHLLDKSKNILKKLRTFTEEEQQQENTLEQVINEHKPILPEIKEPFYAWQCVSLHLQHKTVDFVIEDEHSLLTFLNFISYTVTDNINIERLKRFLAKTRRLSLRNILPGQPSQQNQNSQFIAIQPVSMKIFRLMKIKMKIAYSALLNGYPIIEYLLNAILKAFVVNGIPDDKKQLLDDDSYFQWRKVFKEDNSQSILQGLIKNNLQAQMKQKPIFPISSRPLNNNEDDNQELRLINTADSKLNKSEAVKPVKIGNALLNIGKEETADISQLFKAGSGNFEGFNDYVNKSASMPKLPIEEPLLNEGTTHQSLGDKVRLIDAGRAKSQGHDLQMKRQKSSSERDSEETSSLRSEIIDEEEQRIPLTRKVARKQPEYQVFNSGTFSQIPDFQPLQEPEQVIQEVIDGEETNKNRNQLRDYQRPSVIQDKQPLETASLLMQNEIRNNHDDEELLLNDDTSLDRMMDQTVVKSLHVQEAAYPSLMQTLQSDYGYHKDSTEKTISMSWLAKARNGEFNKKKQPNSANKGVLRINKVPFMQNGFQEESDEQDTLIVHPALQQPLEPQKHTENMLLKPNNTPETRQETITTSAVMFSPQLIGHPQRERLLTANVPQSAEKQMASENSPLFSAVQKEVEQSEESKKEELSSRQEKRSPRFLQQHHKSQQNLMNQNEQKNEEGILLQSMSLFRKSRTGHYDNNILEEELKQEGGQHHHYLNDALEEDIDNNLILMRNQSDQRVMYADLDTEHFKIQSELIRPNGREASRLDRVEDNTTNYQYAMLFENEEIPEQGVELGEKSNTFFRRAKTQRSPEHYNNQAAWGEASDENVEEEEKVSRGGQIGEGDDIVPYDIPKERELSRLEILFRLLAKPLIDSPEDFDSTVQMRSPSFKFYETKDVIVKFFRVNNFKEQLSRRVLLYLLSVESKLIGVREKKGHILRKNLVLLKRLERDKQQKAIEDEIRRQVLKNKDEQEHLKLIIESRKKRQIEEKKGLTYWIRLACIKCLPAKEEHHKSSSHKNKSVPPPPSSNNGLNQMGGGGGGANHSGTPDKKVGNHSKNASILSNGQLGSVSGNQEAGSDTSNAYELRTINSLINRNEKKITSLYQAVKLVSRYQDMQDERLEQLKLKQTMNLKAKGFYLDNADELCKLEFHEIEQRKERYKYFKKKKHELLQMLIKGDDDDKSIQAAQELKVISSTLVQSNSEVKAQMRKTRVKKLRALQALLQKNAENEFAKFLTEYNEVERPVRKIQMLTDRTHNEEMYFNPVLNRLGQFRMVRQLRHTRTKKSGGTTGHHNGSDTKSVNGGGAGMESKKVMKELDQSALKHATEKLNKLESQFF